MKFSMKRSVFLEELAIVQRAIASKTTIPILTGVKIQLNENGLHLTGSNSDISIESFLDKDHEKAELTISEYGSIVLQGRFLGEIIRKLPGDMVDFTQLDHFQMEIKSESAEFTVNGLDAENYPHLPEVDHSNELKLSGAILKKMIGETVFAVSTSESRPILTGVHLVLSHQKLLAVATDSHRLSQQIFPIEQNVADFDIVVPGKSLIELSRILDDDEEVLLSIMNNQILFKTDHMNFYSRLLEGNYPDTSRLIPSNFETKVEFYVPDFLAAIERASLLSHEGRNNIVKLDISSDQVVLYGNSPEVGKVEEVLKTESISGEPLAISFNPDYMKNALQAFGGIYIVVQFISTIRPFILEPAEDDTNFIQLITPVRT